MFTNVTTPLFTDRILIHIFAGINPVNGFKTKLSLMHFSSVFIVVTKWFYFDAHANTLENETCTAIVAFG